MCVLGMTHVGKVRRLNEDNFLIDEALGLFMLGDGMGGHANGGIASTLALQAVRDFFQNTLNQPRVGDFGEDDTLPHPFHLHTEYKEFDPEATWADSSMPAVQTVFAAMEYANHCLYQKNAGNEYGRQQGMGTTLVGCWQCVPGAPMVIFNVGDSRLYLQRDGEFRQLTKDQTLFQQALDMGVTENLPGRNLLLQAIGPAESVVPEVFSHTTYRNDVYLLCSDGLHGIVSDTVISNIMAKTQIENLEQSCTELIQLANSGGGKDNITVVLVICT
jgi:PPM family protein phosphatase